MTLRHVIVTRHTSRRGTETPITVTATGSSQQLGHAPHDTDADAHVSQIRQCNITSDPNCHEVNSTVQSKHFALNSNLSDLKRMHNDLRHQFTEMEAKYRSVNETKAQICELMTSRREQTCSENFVTNKDRCYYVSTFETSLYKAIQECSNRDSRLLEINSREEANFVSLGLMYGYRLYWIGKCESRNASFRLLYKGFSRTPYCRQCDPTAVSRIYPCDREQHFICEKSLLPDIPEKIRGLCQQPVEAT
ncbi:oxidized low-density lipoprotein receptor 1-like [Hemitrygon akajei]|uniref:oxidized low-density lipoprotein receptor 1-like n=1 Tax=Hemitrygon akajei TaxID=2704970 RepID=UPI003BF9E9E8